MAAAGAWDIARQYGSLVFSLVAIIISVWGHVIRYRFAGPRLHLAIRPPPTEKTLWKDPASGVAIPMYFHHLLVSNSRPSAPAQSVRVVLKSLAKGPTGYPLQRVPLTGPIQLAWQHSEKNPQYPTIGPDVHTCDLGHLEPSGFKLQMYFEPNNFKGHLAANESMEIEVQVLADNAKSKSLCLSIAWDGVWTDDTAEVEHHLRVQVVPARSPQRRNPW